MNSRKSWIGTIALLLLGCTLIAWNLRDPDAALIEPPKTEEEVTLDQLPDTVRAAIDRERNGGTIDSIEKESRGDLVTYEVEFIRGEYETEVEIGADGVVLERETKRR